MLFSWTPNFVPNKIFIFGCGGTGSRLVPLVAQFMKSCAWVVQPEIILVDFDSVEDKNLMRQNFIAADVGKNKAVVLANRYSKAFGINISPFISRISATTREPSEVENYNRVNDIICNNERRNTIFVMCVDSPEARKDILKTVLRICCSGANANNLIIDAGNENDFGQIVVSSVSGIDAFDTTNKLNKLDKSAPISVPIPCIPIDTGYYSNMVANPSPSCAELDQTMAINCLVAVNVFSIIQNVYYVKPLTFHRVDVSLQHGTIPQHMNVEYMKRVLDNMSKTNCSELEMLLRRTSFSEELRYAIGKQEEFVVEMGKEKLRNEVKASTPKKKEKDIMATYATIATTTSPVPIQAV